MNSRCTCDPQKCVLALEAGDHWWCSCGLSGHLPFCDGSHKGSGKIPKKFTLKEPQNVALCLCQQTSTPPFCEAKSP